jgi:hypothetical protein
MHRTVRLVKRGVRLGAVRRTAIENRIIALRGQTPHFKQQLRLNEVPHSASLPDRWGVLGFRAALKC